MIGVCLLALAACSFGAITKAPPTATQASIAINPKLRKALLEALSNYDGEDSTEADDESTTSGSDFYDDVTNRPFVKIHTFSVDGDKSNENEVIKTIIITRPRTTLTPPKDPSNDISERKDQVEIKFNKVPDPVSDREIEKTPNIQLVHSIEARTAVSGSEKKDEKPKKKASEKFVTKPITPQITTTTLPPPVTNADGDNIEKVAKDDVKILQAPLLAAFTVSQDGNGQPKNIISLFKNPQPTNVNDDANAKRIVNMEFKASQPAPSFPSAAPAPTVAPSTTVQVPTATTNQQLLTAFEFKQRQLEEQIRFLQAKQREQEEIIRRQQQLQDQQNRQSQFDQQNRHSQFDLNRQRERFEEDQRQRQQFEEDQRQRERFNQEQNFLQRQQQAQAPQQPQTQALQAPPSPSVNVQFIPSIPAGHTVGISVEQQLPFKGPSEFNPDKPEFQKSFGQSLQQFQFRQQQKQLPTQQQQFQQQNQFQQQSTQQQLFLQNPQNFQQQRNFGQQQQLPVAQPLIQQHQVRELQASPLQTNLELPVRQPQNFIQFTQLPTNLELPQRPFQTFNSAPLSVLPSLTDIVPQTQGRTRVFRNDASQTGNFGFNGGNVQIQQQQIDPINYSLDNQLQNLFRQSGINTRSADDFGIISKILSLNHGVPNNLLFANSGRFR